MPKFAANLSFLFTDVPFPARFKRAAAAGFKGVEYLFPYDYPAHEVADWLRESDLEQVLFNLSPGDWAAGDRGLACLPHRQGEFAESVEQALNYAMVLDCERLHCMAGLRPAGVDEAVLEATYIANLRYAADRFATIGATVMIEPINSRIDMPGYWLDSIDQGFCLLEAVDRLIVMEKGRVLLDGAKADVLGQLRSVVEKRRENALPAAVQAAKGPA